MFGYSNLSPIRDITGANVNLQGLNPFYNPEEVKKLVREIEKNPSIELGLDNYYDYISEVIDYGVSATFTRNEILSKKSFAEIERVVERDDQVIASKEMLILSVLQLDMRVEKPKLILPKYEEATEIMFQYWDNWLNNELQGTLSDDLYEINSDEIIYGYALSEKVYGHADNKDFEGKWIIKDIKGKKPGLYKFDLDNFGNPLSITSLYNQMALPLDKFIYSTWKKKRSNIYGSGLADVLYPLCYAKKELLKHGLVGGSKWANPSIVVSTSENPSTAEVDAVETFLNDFHANSGGMLPAPLKAELLEIQNRSQSPILEMIRHINTAIAKTIQSTAAMTNENEKVGSFADSKIKRISAKVNEVYLIRKNEELIKEQIIKPNSRFNFDIDKFPPCTYPSIKFGETEEDDKNGIVTRAKTIFDMGGIDPKNNKEQAEFLRNIDGIPEGTTEEVEAEEIEDPTEDIPADGKEEFTADYIYIDNEIDFEDDSQFDFDNQD
jgi:hypothetical protein